METGVYMFPTDYSIPPDDLAREVESRGFGSLWFPEHTHIPAERVSQWPGGADLPREYWHTYDPFIAITAAAGATKKLLLGTGICLVIERDPIVTAKSVASVDRLSNGRFIFGIGGGWNAEEMANHGTNFRTRFSHLRENILAMKEIWTQEEAEFHGDFVNFDKMWSYPKPLQRPHPPIIMGGDGPTTFDRVVEFCDGWMPTGRGIEPGPLGERIAMLRRQGDEAGRGYLPVSIFGTSADSADMERLEQAGVDRVLFTLPSEDRGKTLPLLDKLAES